MQTKEQAHKYYIRNHEKYRQRYINDKEHIRAVQRVYYERTKKKKAKYYKEWCANNKTLVKRLAKQYYEKNREAIRKYNRNYYIANREDNIIKYAKKRRRYYLLHAKTLKRKQRERNRLNRTPTGKAIKFLKAITNGS